MTSRRQAGQAVIEALVLVPLVLAGALTAGQLLAAGVCRELAGHAAEAGAAAILQGTDPVAAARRSLPGWSREHLRIELEGRRVVVHVRAPDLVPGLAARLAGRAAADAGPTG